MGKRYNLELELLDTTYREALAKDSEPLDAAALALGGRSLVAVGSGGSYSAAHYAAQLHNHYTGQLAMSATPLELMTMKIPRSTTLLIISARGRNSDILKALKVAANAEVHGIVVITNDINSPLAKQAETFGHPIVLDMGLSVKNDGYLATNTLICTVILLFRAYSAVFGTTNITISPSLYEMLHGTQERQVYLEKLKLKLRSFSRRTNVVTLYGGWSSSAAIDTESRFGESALFSVQRVDFRNFAHGRHQWFVRRAEESAALAFVTPSLKNLAEKTMDKLPLESARAILESKMDGPVGGLNLLIQSLFVTQVLAEAAGIDPGRPKVPQWCRKLYHMKPSIKSNKNEAIILERKFGTQSLHRWHRDWEQTLKKSLSYLRASEIRGLVLDYDGTVVETAERFQDPREDVQKALLRLLSEGMYIGFATGRGKSVRKSLQRILPKKLWSQVIIGYYNGTDIAPLVDSDSPDGSEYTEIQSLQAFIKVVESNATFSFSREDRPFQVTLIPEPSQELFNTWLKVNALIDQHQIPVRALKSSHSIDILPLNASKVAVVDALADVIGCSVDQVLRIGDQGAWPGNDYQLLSHSLSISVREPSSDLNGGWVLTPRGCIGTRALIKILGALMTDDTSWRINLEHVNQKLK